MYREFLERLVADGHIYKGEDGYYVLDFFNLRGSVEVAALRAIADYLDELNKEWDEQVKANLEKIEQDK